LGLERFEARLRQYRGLARFELGDPDGLADLRAALDAARVLGDTVGTSFAYSNLGTVTLALSVGDAAEIYDEAVEFAGRRGMGGGLMWLRAERTWALYELGRWDEVVRETDAVE